jgi:RNA recognition motif-containing protein
LSIINQPTPSSFSKRNKTDKKNKKMMAWNSSCFNNLAINEQHTNIFVKFLPHETTDESLALLFSPFGKIVSAKVMVDQQIKRSLGYG